MPVCDVGYIKVDGWIVWPGNNNQRFVLVSGNVSCSIFLIYRFSNVSLTSLSNTSIANPQTEPQRMVQS